MKTRRDFLCKGGGASPLRSFGSAGIAAYLVLMGLAFYLSQAAAIEIPPEVQKKAVSLKQVNAAAERFYRAECRKCHKMPDPAGTDAARPECESGLDNAHIEQMRTYLANVRAGKSLYESYCGRCHELIEPGSHTFEYWSKNICTSDSCMVKKRLNGDEEQQVLLYLSAHAEKD